MTKLAFVFPGQGSQAIGMLAELETEHSEVTEVFEEASKVLGYNLWQLIQDGPVENLNQTNRTQPALLAASVAIWRVWQKVGGQQPNYLAGHSLGEYSALVCAGVIDFKDAIKLVELRGNYMQQAVAEGIGAMYAIIGLDDEKVIAACEEAAQGDVVSAVNFNSPGQVVIAGSKDAVERAGSLCKEAGAKRALPLPVSVPSHCELMKPAAEKLAEKLQEINFNSPQIPVVNNVDVATQDSPEEIKQALIRQLYCPVRWTESVEFLSQNGVERMIEAGPGKVLSGLIKRINRSITCESVNTPDSMNSANQ